MTLTVNIHHLQNMNPNRLSNLYSKFIEQVNANDCMTRSFITTNKAKPSIAVPTTD